MCQLNEHGESNQKIQRTRQLPNTWSKCLASCLPVTFTHQKLFSWVNEELLFRLLKSVASIELFSRKIIRSCVGRNGDMLTQSSAIINIRLTQLVITWIARICTREGNAGTFRDFERKHFRVRVMRYAPLLSFTSVVTCDQRTIDSIPIWQIMYKWENKTEH